MRNKSWLVFVLLILLVLPLINAAPPFVANPDTSEVPGLEITFPLLDIYPTNDNISFNFHIFNATNFPIEDYSVECKFHVYDNSGHHILYENLTLDTNDGDFEYLTNRTILVPGDYAYLINCNSSTLHEAGFVSSTFRVTDSGLEEKNTSSSILYLGVLFILVFFLVLSIAGAWSIDGENEYDLGGGLVKVNFNKYFKLGLFFLSYLLLIFVVFVSLAISTNFLFLDSFSAILGIIHYVLWILLAPVFLAFMAHSLQKFILDLKIQELAKRNLPDRKGDPKKW